VVCEEYDERWSAGPSGKCSDPLWNFERLMALV
jgi:hypothetical protein